MIRPEFLTRLANDRRASTIVEFALLAPMLVGMLLGIFQVALQLQGYNALRAIASDISRYTVVEYQKDNKITATQIRTQASSIAVTAPYLLQGDSMDVGVVEVTSRVTGAKEFEVELSYSPLSLLEFINVGSVTITYNRSIFVST